MGSSLGDQQLVELPDHVGLCVPAQCPPGERLADQFRETQHEAAASELVSEAGGDLLASVGRLEDALNQAGVYERVMRRVKKREQKKVQIIDYRSQFKRYFKSLNLEWLQEYYSVEKADENQLAIQYVVIGGTP